MERLGHNCRPDFANVALVGLSKLAAGTKSLDDSEGGEVGDGWSQGAKMMRRREESHDRPRQSDRREGMVIDEVGKEGLKKLRR